MRQEGGKIVRLIRLGGFRRGPSLQFVARDDDPGRIVVFGMTTGGWNGES